MTYWCLGLDDTLSYSNKNVAVELHPVVGFGCVKSYGTKLNIIIIIINQIRKNASHA